jgi:hypothetical protein
MTGPSLGLIGNRRKRESGALRQRLAPDILRHALGRDLGLLAPPTI